MPRATVAVDTERFDLKTLPEGFVVIRRMTFGEKLERTDQMMKIHGSTVDKDNPFEMSMSTKRIALKDFGALIVEHNLTDENDRMLNFKDAKDVVRLDPKVGDEITELIDSINSYEGSQELKN